MDEESLVENPIFSRLQDAIEDFPRRASGEGWLILIPQLASIGGVGFNVPGNGREFLDHHVLAPRARGLESEYVSLAGDGVVIRDGQVEVASRKVVVRILFDEVFYNEHGSFKAFCISRPMAVCNGLPRFVQEDGGEVFDERRNVEDWMFLLNRDARNGTALRYLEQVAETIKTSYVLVANRAGIDHFASKVRKSVDVGVELLIKHNPGRYQPAAVSKAMRLILSRALEAYLMTGVHEMVFASLCKFHSKSELRLRHKASQLHVSNNAKEMNLFHVLEMKRCPLEKMEYLRKFVNEQKSVDMNADQLLGLLVLHIATAPRSANVLANLYYMREFRGFPPANELDFLVTQLHAAVTYLDDNPGPVGRNLILSHPHLALAKPLTADEEDEIADQDMATSFPFLAPAPPQPEDSLTNQGVDQEEQHQAEEEEEDRQDDGDDVRLGGFLQRLKACNADVVTSSSNNLKLYP